METTKQVSFRCPVPNYLAYKEKADKANMTPTEYINRLIENDLRNNQIALNQKELIVCMCRISTSINHIAERYPKDEDVKNLKAEVKKAWQISL